MWTCKIKIDSRATVTGKLCCKYGVNVALHPFSSVVRECGGLINFILFLFCDEEKRKLFFKEFESSEGIANAWMKDHYIVGQLELAPELTEMFKCNIIHLEPIRVDAKGYEFWTIASWDKMELMKFCKILEKIYGLLLLGIKERPISNVSILTIHPELTESQRRAVDLAVENDYYDIPRGIQLEELAKLMGVSYSTYQAHLRKAEKKLLPFFSGHLMS